MIDLKLLGELYNDRENRIPIQFFGSFSRGLVLAAKGRLSEIEITKHD
jgi:hypothetical protein